MLSNKDFSHFWHERFEMDIPASMLSLVSVMLQCLLTSKPTMQVPKDGYIFTTHQRGLANLQPLLAHRMRMFSLTTIAQLMI